MCPYFCNDLPAASSGRAIRRSGVPPIERWWFLLAFNGRSHLWDQLNVWRIDHPSSCCWLLEPMSLTSSAKNKWLHVSSSAKSLINIRKRRGPSTEPWGTPLFTAPTLEWWSPNFTLKVLLFRNSSTAVYLGMDVIWFEVWKKAFHAGWRFF